MILAQAHRIFTSDIARNFAIGFAAGALVLFVQSGGFSLITIAPQALAAAVK